jgi:hypothetical protein
MSIQTFPKDEENGLLSGLKNVGVKPLVIKIMIFMMQLC